MLLVLPLPKATHKDAKKVKLQTFAIRNYELPPVVEMIMNFHNGELTINSILYFLPFSNSLKVQVLKRAEQPGIILDHPKSTWEPFNIL
jgi:hypothetical protein